MSQVSLIIFFWTFFVHRKLNAALTEQAGKLWHTSNVFMNEPIHEFTEKLASKMPGDLKVVYPVNSGSEANDLALLMARVYTGNYDVIALRNAYHGMSPHTMGLTGHSTWKQTSPHYFSIHHVHKLLILWAKKIFSKKAMKTQNYYLFL